VGYTAANGTIEPIATLGTWVAPTEGRFARHLAADLLAGARAAGVI
jgi:hypothetical protein